MKKYIYKYCVYLNNCCSGVRFVCACDGLIEALNKKEQIQNNGGGCCDVVKKRFIIGGTTPIINPIYNNYRYSGYDLPDNCFYY